MVTQISDEFGHIDVLPNFRWMLVYDRELPGIDLFSETDEYVRHITNQSPDHIIWQPDSNALFYRLGTELYFVAIPDGQPIRIDENVAAFGYEYDYNFAWVNSR